MDLFAKGVLQGSVPVIVLVGGTHHFVKKFRESKPVLYWGSLAVATGAAIGIVTGRIPAPFMNAESEMETCAECGMEVDEDDIIGDGTNRGLCCVPDYYDDDDYDAETFGAENPYKDDHLPLIISIDTSMSTTQGDMLEKYKGLAAEAIKEFRMAPMMYVIEHNNPCSILYEGQDRQKAIKLIYDLQPYNGTARLNELIDMIHDIESKTPTGKANKLIFTDV